jgi:hypothetical protein
MRIRTGGPTVKPDPRVEEEKQKIRDKAELAAQNSMDMGLDADDDDDNGAVLAVRCGAVRCGAVQCVRDYTHAC